MNITSKQPPAILTSVNAEQLKQVGYEKDSIIDVFAGRTGNNKRGTWSAVAHARQHR